MSSPARPARSSTRRPAPSAVPLGGAGSAPRAEAAGGSADGAGRPGSVPGHTVSHTTGSIRLRSSRTGAPRTGSVRGRGRTGQQGARRSTPVRPELRLLPVAGAARADRAQPAPRSRRAPFVLLVVGLLVATTIGLLVINTAVAVDSLKATSMRSANNQRAQEVQRLQQEVIDGDTPQRLVDEATRAGLVPAGTPGHLVVRPDGSTVLRGTPAPAPAAPPTGAFAPAPAPNGPAGTPDTAAGD